MGISPVGQGYFPQAGRRNLRHRGMIVSSMTWNAREKFKVEAVGWSSDDYRGGPALPEAVPGEGFGTQRVAAMRRARAVKGNEPMPDQKRPSAVGGLFPPICTAPSGYSPGTWSRRPEDCNSSRPAATVTRCSCSDARRGPVQATPDGITVWQSRCSCLPARCWRC